MAAQQFKPSVNGSQTEHVPQSPVAPAAASLADKLAELQASLAEVTAAISGGAADAPAPSVPHAPAAGIGRIPSPLRCVSFTITVPLEIKTAIMQRAAAVHLDPSRIASALLLNFLHQMTPEKNGRSIIRGLEAWERTQRNLREWPWQLPALAEPEAEATSATGDNPADAALATLAPEVAKGVIDLAEDAGVTIAEVFAQAVDEFLDTIQQEAQAASAGEQRFKAPKPRLRRERGGRTRRRSYCETCARDVLPTEGYRPQLCFIVTNKLGFQMPTFSRDHARAVAMDKANDLLQPSEIKTVLAYLAPVGAAVDSVTVHPRRPRLETAKVQDAWHTDIDLDVGGYSGPGRIVASPPPMGMDAEVSSLMEILKRKRLLAKAGKQESPTPCQCHEDRPANVIPLDLDLAGRFGNAVQS